MYQFAPWTLLPYAPAFVAAFGQTVFISLVALAVSFPAGLIGAFARTSRVSSVRAIAAIYVELLRNLPFLVLLYLLYFTLPATGLKFDAVASGVLALALNSTAYTIEIFRGGLKAIPDTQYQAAYSLGMRPYQVLIHVVIPQVLRLSFPGLGNQVVAVVLSSSLVSVIGVSELTYRSLVVGSKTFRYFEVLALAGILYLGAIQLIKLGWSWMGMRGGFRNVGVR
jgi:polar amino acid transport system permease protein